MREPMKFLRVTMPDGSRWDVPAQVVVDDYRRHYGGTEPEPDDYELKDWAAGNMDWADVVEHARKIADGPALDAHDFQEGWVNGEKEVVDRALRKTAPAWELGKEPLPRPPLGPRLPAAVRGICSGCGLPVDGATTPADEDICQCPSRLQP